MSQPIRVVVCGTLFGQVYLSAFDRPFPGFELAGILARGSERSQALAQRYGVPLYQDVDALPQDIDIACVVIRSAIVGGAGSDIAQALLKRGISVLQEHPVYQSDVAQCLKLARQHQCGYQVNTHYPHVPAVRQFIAYLRKALTKQPALFIEASCGVQVICSLLDILGRIFGRFAPYAFDAPGIWSEAILGQLTTVPPYTPLRGMIAGVPLTLNLQNQLDPADPDNHFHIMHRLCLGLPGGNLLLVNTHGPLIWQERFHLPRQRSATGCREPLLPQDAPRYFQSPLFTPFPAEADNLQTILHRQWPSAVRHALREFAAQCLQPEARHGQHLLALTAVWRTLMSQVGNPQSMTFAPPPPVHPAPQAFVDAWQGEDDE